MLNKKELFILKSSGFVIHVSVPALPLGQWRDDKGRECEDDIRR